MTKSLRITCSTIAIALALACGKAPEKTDAGAAKKTENEALPKEVKLSTEALKAAEIQIEPVASGPKRRVLQFTGTIEANQQQVQQVTPLVSGRVDSVQVALGSAVGRGSVLAMISSPEVAEMHGKLLEAQAKLNQSEATLRRTKRLTEIGAAAGKDLIAAEAEAQTAQLDVQHLRDALRAVGAPPEKGRHSIASVALRSPISGLVIERNVNPGSGAEANKPLFTVANLSNVWVIASVPEAQVSMLSVGSRALVQSAATGTQPLSGTVSYIDPVLNEATRTARVRVEVNNPQWRLKVGMFATISIEANTIAASQLTVPDDAVQRVDEKDVVFVAKPAAGAFDVRPVTAGEKIGDQRVITGGLQPGERIATKGSFTLKAQLLKSQFAEGD